MRNTMGSTEARPAQGLLERLPHGGTLPDAVWRKRHHALVALLLAQALALFVFAMLQNKGFGHTLVELGAMIPLAAAALLLQDQRRVASLLVRKRALEQRGGRETSRRRAASKQEGRARHDRKQSAATGRKKAHKTPRVA